MVIIIIMFMIIIIKRMVTALCLWMNRVIFKVKVIFYILNEWFYFKAKKRSLLYRKKLQNTLEHRDVKEEELSSILERLKKQAKLVNSKNLTNDWDEQLLQKELEGECHMLKVLHARNANFFGKFFQERFFSISYSIPFFTYLDTCKARTANRKIMSKKKEKT